MGCGYGYGEEYDHRMGFIPERLEPLVSPHGSLETGPIAARTNVTRGSATRIRLDAEGEPVYGHEVPVELGFWAREIPDGKLAPGWSHRWLRLECRYDPPTPQASRSRVPTVDDLERRTHDLARIRMESAGQPVPPRRLVEALVRQGIAQGGLRSHEQAVCTLSEACAAATLVAEATGSAPAEVDLLAHCHHERGEVLRAAGRPQEARSAFETAIERLRPLASRPEHAEALVRSLEVQAKVLEALGLLDEARVVLDEAVERGSLAPRTDTLVIAEFPLAGRRRFDRAVFRRGLDQKRPYFGSKLAKHVRERLERAMQASGRAADVAGSLGVNVVALVLEALEDPAVVARDPFTSNDRVLIAGISSPTPPFTEPEHDYTPGWSDEDAARTGWVLGVCRDAEAVHAKVVEALEDMVKEAVEGKLAVFPPSRSDGRPWRPPGDLIGPAAQRLAAAAAWLAMAGPKDPVRRGTRVVHVAEQRLNDLLYNFVRKTGLPKGSPRVALVEEERGATGVIDEPPIPVLPIDEQRERLTAFLARHASEEWAHEGKRLLARCSAPIGRDDEALQQLVSETRACHRRYRHEPRFEEVIDFVRAWIEDGIAQRA